MRSTNKKRYSPLQRYSSAERLPFECELISRETTHSEFRPQFHDIRHSISDYYLNDIHTNGGISSNCIQFERFREKSFYETICDETHTSDSDNREKSGHDYGSCAPTRAMSVEFINHSFITSITDLPFGSKQKPTEKSAAIVSGTTLVMMITMLLMAITSTHITSFLNKENHWWTQLLITLFFIIICICIITIAGQPQQKPQNSVQSNNRVPCSPLLPICCIWFDIHLIVCLPYTSWLVFVIWSLLGVFVYMSYGVWNSLEGTPLRDFEQNNGMIVTDNSDDSEDIIACDHQIIGSSV